MTFTPTNCLVWAEIPVTDMEASIAFYQTVTGGALTYIEDGPNPMASFQAADPSNGVALHLYPGKPAGDGSGPTVHLAAEGALESVMERVSKAGGNVLYGPISIPAGRFFYATDPDGNSIGFFETAD